MEVFNHHRHFLHDCDIAYHAKFDSFTSHFMGVQQDTTPKFAGSW